MGKSLNDKNNMRKIIQISTVNHPLNLIIGKWSIITALCDDGTLWQFECDFEIPNKIWKKLPDIPQTDIKD
jgi:ribosome-associated toxin RatA of RatAB toxin-antitoxin module